MKNFQYYLEMVVDNPTADAMQAWVNNPKESQKNPQREEAQKKSDKEFYNILKERLNILEATRLTIEESLKKLKTGKIDFNNFLKIKIKNYLMLNSGEVQFLDGTLEGFFKPKIIIKINSLPKDKKEEKNILIVNEISQDYLDNLKEIYKYKKMLFHNSGEYSEVKNKKVDSIEKIKQDLIKLLE